MALRFFYDDGDDDDDDDDGDDVTSGSAHDDGKRSGDFQYSYCGCAVADQIYFGGYPGAYPYPALQGKHASSLVHHQSYHCSYSVYHLHG